MDRDFQDIDELLREWGFFFRDIRRREACRSIEHRYRRTAEEGDPEGWGMPAPVQQYKTYILRRAETTHEAIQQLDKKYKWALTYAFCYPFLKEAVVLRLMKKYTGHRLNRRQYEDMLLVARSRVWTLLR